MTREDLVATMVIGLVVTTSCCQVTYKIVDDAWREELLKRKVMEYDRTTGKMVWIEKAGGPHDQVSR